MTDIGPGDLVVCVDASRCVSTGKITGLIEGRAYTVSGVGRALYHGVMDWGLWLVGLRAPSSSGQFNHSRFRKLDDGDTKRLIEKLGVDMDAKEPVHV